MKSFARALCLGTVAAVMAGSCQDERSQEPALNDFVVRAGNIEPTASAAALPTANSAVADLSYPGLIQRGRAELGRGDPGSAEKTLRQALALDPNQPDAHLWLSLVARSRGDEPARCEHLRRYVQLKPDNTARAFYQRELEKCR
jgi:hypothetical protein